MTVLLTCAASVSAIAQAFALRSFWRAKVVTDAHLVANMCLAASTGVLGGLAFVGAARGW